MMGSNLHPCISSALPSAIAASVQPFDQAAQKLASAAVGTDTVCEGCGRSGLAAASASAPASSSRTTQHRRPQRMAAAWDDPALSLMCLWRLDALARTVMLVGVEWRCERCRLLADPMALVQLLAGQPLDEGDVATPLAQHFALMHKNGLLAPDVPVMAKQVELQHYISTAFAQRVRASNAPGVRVIDTQGGDVTAVTIKQMLKAARKPAAQAQMSAKRARKSLS